MRAWSIVNVRKNIRATKEGDKKERKRKMCPMEKRMVFIESAQAANEMTANLCGKFTNSFTFIFDLEFHIFGFSTMLLN